MIERAWIVVVGLVVVASCRSEVAQEADIPRPPASSEATARGTALDSAARQIVGFLRGEVGFDRVRLADSVTLYVSPEGGGTRRTFAREQLRDRASWRVPGQGRAMHSFVPPASMSRLETRVGRHFNCQEHALSTRSPELARLPHVGTKLEPADGSSCLQTWNVTLVFDPNQTPPTLVAALYDQWEW